MLNNINEPINFHHPSPITHHPTSNIHHPTSITHHPSSIIDHPTSITHHPTSNIQHPTPNIHLPNLTNITFHIPSFHYFRNLNKKTTKHV